MLVLTAFFISFILRFVSDSIQFAEDIWVNDDAFSIIDDVDFTLFIFNGAIFLSLNAKTIAIIFLIF